jgi:NADH-quinone oxidoreductase subunit L
MLFDSSGLAWWLLILPLLSSVATLVYLHRKPNMAVYASVASAALCFLITLGIVAGSVKEPEPFVWMSFPGLHIEIGMILDSLSKGMLMVVTGVGLLVHIFSIGYMAHDKAKARFFGGLSIFMFSMTGIVIATNLIEMFFFWEGVGFSSYLLIGFWFDRESAAQAANKAFICNRLADFGFMVGILTLWFMTGSVSVRTADLKDAYFHANPPPAAARSVTGPDLAAAMAQPAPVNLSTSSGGTSTTLSHPLMINGGGVQEVSNWLGLVLVVGLFAGCMGKSAMFPFHVWLPDAMEGPTPVSALIHAATMVAAGVYMLCRVYPLLLLSSAGMWFIACIGCFTAIFAALIAVQQNDIKRILAYSTLSQLGYMVMAVGCHGPSAAMFHLTTHAFFKALLFLAAGSVIHALHEEQDIWRMGGLAKKIPLTFWTFLLGMLALIGFPGFAGFFSKDLILAVAYQANPWFYWVGVFTAFLTAFYMTRLVVVAFLGHGRTEAAQHPHESPAVMTVPLIILAVLSVIGGFALGIKGFYHGWSVDQLRDTGQIPADTTTVALPELSLVLGTVVPLLMVFGGIGLAWALYSGRDRDPLHIKVLAHKFYFDEFYDTNLVGGQQLFARFLNWIDSWVLEGAILRGLAYLSVGAGELLKLLQTGSLQTYAFILSVGSALLIYFTLFAH